MAAPSTADATLGDAAKPDRATTPAVAVTTDPSDHGTPPPQTYNDSNYHFNHSTPGNTVYYNPTTVMDQLHITERQTTATPPLPDNTPYTQFFTALTLEEYQLLSQQQATPLAQLDYTRPIHCTPGDLRMPPHCSAFHYLKQPTSTTTTRLHSTLQPATTPTTSSSNSRLNNHNSWGTSLQDNFYTSRDYISYMMSIQQNYYLPTTPIPQTIHKVNYNMTTFPDNYSLRNNYLWNYHMPLLLPEPLHYLYNLQECPVLRIHTTHHDKPHSTSHRFLREYDQHMSCPEIDDERQHDNLFHHTLLRDLGQQTPDGPRLSRPEMGTTSFSSCSTTTSACLATSIQRPTSSWNLNSVNY